MRTASQESDHEDSMFNVPTGLFRSSTYGSTLESMMSDSNDGNQLDGCSQNQFSITSGDFSEQLESAYSIQSDVVINLMKQLHAELDEHSIDEQVHTAIFKQIK